MDNDAKELTKAAQTMIYAIRRASNAPTGLSIYASLEAMAAAALLYEAAEDYARAEHWFQEHLTLSLKWLDHSASEISLARLRLQSFYERRGELKKALRQAVAQNEWMSEVYGRFHAAAFNQLRMSAEFLQRIGCPQQARELQQIAAEDEAMAAKMSEATKAKYKKKSGA